MTQIPVWVTTVSQVPKEQLARNLLDHTEPNDQVHGSCTFYLPLCPFYRIKLRLADRGMTYLLKP